MNNQKEIVIPKFGDVVILPKTEFWKWANLKPGSVGVLSGNKNHPFCSINFNPSVFLNDNLCTCSGGPASILPIQFDILEFHGQAEIVCWNWGDNLPGAGKGVQVKKVVNAWMMTSPIEFVGYNNETKEYDFNIRVPE